MTAIEQELYRAAAADPRLANRVLDVFSRTRRPAQAVPMRRGLTLAVRALRRPDADPRAVLRATADELGGALTVQGQRLAARPRAGGDLRVRTGPISPADP